MGLRYQTGLVLTLAHSIETILEGVRASWFASLKGAISCFIGNVATVYF